MAYQSPGRHPAREEIRYLRTRLDTEHRFGRPSDFGLTDRELAAHIRQLLRAGWLQWEVRVRFGFNRRAA
jgi:hypothetical protein